MTRKEKIISLMAREAKPMPPDEIAAAISLPEKSRPAFDAMLAELEAEGEIMPAKGSGLISCRAAGLIRGVLRVNSKGFGFLICEEGEDIHIEASAMNTAVNGDTVLVRLLPEAHGRREGAVEKVLRRGNERLVGTLRLYKGMAIVTPDDDRLPREMFVTGHQFAAKDGMKVVARITEYMKNGLRGRVEEVLGYPDDFGVDVLSIIKSYDFNTEFPQKVMDEADFAPEEVSADDLDGRLDLRGEAVITIDGDDSKDLDDAISLTKTESGCRLGVHIADVGHYVRPGSALDREALARGTSVYLVDRVIPMLPPRLSNGICSLNEGEDRLTLSVIMDIDSRGNVLHSEFSKSVIRSSHRMTYNKVWRLLSGDAALAREYADVAPMLRDMYALSRELGKRAAERGYVDLDIPEAKAVLDENGRAVDITLREINGANTMIENFMVCANAEVARYLWRRHVPAMYRVHGKPDADKLAVFKSYAAGLGLNPNRDFRAIMADFKDRPERGVASMMLLRCMAKAFYSPENTGHFGLAAPDYCHFTSPIRRYPDLVCHRALKAAIEGDAAAMRKIGRMNAEAAVQCSDRELAAEHCERDTLDLKKAEYMEPFVGSDFDAVISSVASFGFFVELPNTVEGLVPVTSLSDDYYVLDEATLTLRGERRHKEYRLGDAVRVTLVSANKQSRKLEFVVKTLEEKKKITVKGVSAGGGAKGNKNSRPKQKRVSRVFHRRKNRGRD